MARSKTHKTIKEFEPKIDKEKENLDEYIPSKSVTSDNSSTKWAKIEASQIEKEKRAKNFKRRMTRKIDYKADPSDLFNE